MAESASPLLTYVGFGFILFAGVLLAVPVALVLKRVQPWKGVIGLWVAGWGFLLIGLGVRWLDQGGGGFLVPGVIVTTVGHIIQRRFAAR